MSAQIAKRLEAGAFPADQVDDPKQVDRRARQPVKLGHDQDVTSLKLIERALQFRPPGGNAGHLLAEYPLNACGQEQRLLRRQRLPGRGDAGVSVDCHFAQDIRTKVMPDITTSAIWCATCKFYNRRPVCSPGAPPVRPLAEKRATGQLMRALGHLMHGGRIVLIRGGQIVLMRLATDAIDRSAEALG